MYQLRNIYGYKSYLRWCDEPQPEDLSGDTEDAGDVMDGRWVVSSYPDLVDAVSFLTVMNKRLDLAYRGQEELRPQVPTLFRGSWLPPWGGHGRVSIGNRDVCRSRLAQLGPLVFRICKQIGLPRWRTLQDLEQAQWAVIQHYGLWPTPMIDLSRSLRVAATFALRERASEPAADDALITGNLFVAGVPNRSGSITCSLDDQMLVAALSSVCPPAARRPHLQDGLLVSRFPTVGVAASEVGKNDLRLRTVAHIKLVDRSRSKGFWSNDFPRLSRHSLMPTKENDPLLKAFEDWIEYVPTSAGAVDWCARMSS
ncbi:MAG: FRG domain-containing protein [Jatrophihabitantaceae bacterium]